MRLVRQSVRSIIKDAMQKKANKLSAGQKKLLRLAVALLIVVALSAAAFFLADPILNNPNVYYGVKIEGYSVGGMSPDELRSFLNDRYGAMLDSIDFTFFTQEYEKTVSMTDLGISIDIAGMEQRALAVGREGFFMKRLLDINRLRKSPVNITLNLVTDHERLDMVIEDINRFFRTDVTAPKLIISGDTVILCTGVSGWEVDKAALKAKIIESLMGFKDTYLHIPLTEIMPPRIDIDTAYKSILQSPADAEIVKNSDGTASIKPQVNGRHIDKAVLADIIKRLEEREYRPYEEIELPVEITEPKVKTRELEALLFRDVLASVSTAFTTDTQNNRNRGINIRLAAASVDGAVVFPGEEFSFNDRVGPRTSDRGYVIAHVFSEGQVRDGIGGGVCQVSTTLFNAALLSNLSITERHNHMFAVGYVPLGLDAAVSYGYSDLRFRNNTEYPIRIDAEVSANNILTFSILGTNLYPDIRVKPVSKVISTTRSTVEYIDDPNLPAGAEITEDNGIDGAVVDTFVQIYSGDDLIKDYKLHTSTYLMLPRKVRRGVGEVPGKGYYP
jgi:vancomycin resistance protein YoaR